uniref:Venom toxin n=1 Tax=Hemiscorpius lepturus TaxID=520031 RepID=A0A1L4BJ68_HEMLE|nr:venom toxin [Hemiscorpius lepturus]
MWLRLALVLTLIVSIHSLSCPCWRDRSICRPAPTDCKLGLTKDACGCCDICFKIEGEKCGGPWGTSGRCGEGLECVAPKPEKAEDVPQHIARHQEGVCKPK